MLVVEMARFKHDISPPTRAGDQRVPQPRDVVVIPERSHRDIPLE